MESLRDDNMTRFKAENIRTAILDRFGGKDSAIGKKANPGVLYGLSGDCWSALAIAITFHETVVLQTPAALVSPF